MATAIPLFTAETVPGKTVEMLGMVQGSTVRSKNIGKDIMACCKSIVGGELKGYSEMLVEAREEASKRMIQQAKEMSANAIVGVRYTSSDIAEGVSEVMVYGTAVILT